jgi:hypothetical protein
MKAQSREERLQDLEKLSRKLHEAIDEYEKRTLETVDRIDITHEEFVMAQPVLIQVGVTLEPLKA